jgi:hypothetical protein
MSGSGKRPRGARTEANEVPLITAVDDEIYDELSELVGQRVVHIALWEDSLVDALADATPDPMHQSAFDIDLYLEDGVYFELYGVTCFDDPDGDPWSGHAATQARFAALVGGSATLAEVAVDEDDGLVLVLESANGGTVFLAVAAWLPDEWDELPEE